MNRCVCPVNKIERAMEAGGLNHGTGTISLEREPGSSVRLGRR
jgi:hypothetical protein